MGNGLEVCAERCLGCKLFGSLGSGLGEVW